MKDQFLVKSNRNTRSSKTNENLPYQGVELHSWQMGISLLRNSWGVRCRIWCLVPLNADCPGTFWSLEGLMQLWPMTRWQQTPWHFPHRGSWPLWGDRWVRSWWTRRGQGAADGRGRGTTELCVCQTAGRSNRKGLLGETAHLLKIWSRTRMRLHILANIILGWLFLPN